MLAAMATPSVSQAAAQSSGTALEADGAPAPSAATTANLEVCHRGPS